MKRYALVTSFVLMGLLLSTLAAAVTSPPGGAANAVALATAAANAENVELVGHIDTPGHARSIVVVGDYAYVADEGVELRVVDVSTPSNPTEVGFYDTPGDASWDMVVAGDYAYITYNDFIANYDHGLRVVDISAPDNPTGVGFYNRWERAYGVAVAGDYAYVAARYEGLRVVDVSDPFNPTEVGFYEPPCSASDVAVVGDYAYVADWNYGLGVVDVSTPSNPTEVGYCYEGGIRSVAVAGNNAYCVEQEYSGDEDGLWIVDISIASNPTEVGFYDTPGDPWGVTVAGNYAYVADGYSGLRVVDVSDPFNSTEVGFYDTPGSARDVAVVGGYVYVADYDEGLFILRYTGGEGVIYSISGYVRDGSGNPIPGVVISAGAAGNTTTNADGYYTLRGISAGTYTLTPIKSGYTFSPATRTVTVPPDATGQDFTGSTPLKVIATTPTDGAVEVSRATPITATFNISVDSTTLNEDTVLVSDGSFDLLGTVIYDDQTRTVRFVVNRFTFLNPGNVYTVTLTDEIAAADSSTNTLQTYRWKFTTATYSLDSDGDGLTDMVEYDGWKVGKKQYTSNPFDPDTDDDFLNDSVEKQGCTDPRNDDTDGDELKDAEEDEDRDAKVDFGETDPRLWDTDGDGLKDGDDPVPCIVTNRKALVIWLMDYPWYLRWIAHPHALSDAAGVGKLDQLLSYLGFVVSHYFDTLDDGYFFTYDRVSNWIDGFANSLDPDDVAIAVIHSHGYAFLDQYRIAYGDGLYPEPYVTRQMNPFDPRLDLLWLLTCHSWAYRDEVDKLDAGEIIFLGNNTVGGAKPSVAGFYMGIAGGTVAGDPQYWEDYYDESKALRFVEAVTPTMNAARYEGYEGWQVQDDYNGNMDLLSPWLSPQAAVIARTTLAGAPSPIISPTASFSETTYTAFDSTGDGYTDAITISWTVETTMAEEEVLVSAVVYDSSSNSLEAYAYGPYTIHRGSVDMKSLEFYASASDIYRVSLDLYSLPATLSDLDRLEDISLHQGPGPQDGHEAFTSVVLTDGSTVGAGEVITVTWSASTTLPSEQASVFASLGTNPEFGTVLEVKGDGPYTIYSSSPNSQVVTLTLPGSGIYYVDLCLIDSSFKMEDCTELKLWATGVYSDTGVDTNSNGLYDSLAIDLGLNIPQDGDYTLNGNLYDEAGSYIASASESCHFSAGFSTATLQFDGEIIRKSRRSGPYVLRDLKLLSDDGSSDMIGAVYTTFAYQYTQFELPTAMFNGRFDEIGEDTNGDALWDILSISVGMDLAVPESYEVSGYLSDSSGSQLDYKAISETLEAGPYTVTLDFDGLAVAENGADGPYVLEQLTLRSGDGEVLDRLEAAYATQAYSHTWFQPPPATLSGSFGDHGTDLDGDGLYEFLTIDIGLAITDTGLYRMEGLLADSEGEAIRWAGVTDLLNRGQQTVQLNFDGQAIRENRVSGAFDLVQINLIDYYTETWRYLSQQSDVYVTQSYSCLDFGEREHLFLPLILRSG